MRIFLLCVFLSQHYFKDTKTLQFVQSRWLWAHSFYVHVLPTIIAASYISTFSQVSFPTGPSEGFHTCETTVLAADPFVPWNVFVPEGQRLHLKNL